MNFTPMIRLRHLNALVILAVLCLLPFSVYGDVNIYVAPSGDDATGSGTAVNPYHTLSKAYDVIQVDGSSCVTAAHNVILVNENDTPVTVGADQILWTKSGTAAYPIRICSEDNIVTVIRGTDMAAPILKLKDVQYICLTRVRFENASMAIELTNADYCAISKCEFVANGLAQGSGGGMIWIGKNEGWDPGAFWISGWDPNDPDPDAPNDPVSDVNLDQDQVSRFNIIENNLFYGLNITRFCDRILHHPIYISRGAYDNTIRLNTIWTGKRAGDGVTFNHNYQKRNEVINNFIYKEEATWADACVPVNPPLDRDDNVVTESEFNSSWLMSRYGILLAGDGPGGTKHPYTLTTIVDNVIENNTVYVDAKHCATAAYSVWFCTSPDATTAYKICDTAEDPNSNADMAGQNPDALRTANSLYFGDDDSLHYLDDGQDPYGDDAGSDSHAPRDPYWLGYVPDQITGRVVSGDFDNDGAADIAAFYENGVSSTAVHTWLSDTVTRYNRPSDTYLHYSGSQGWWSSLGYQSALITDRVVCGDFNGDGRDDIAALYANGATSTVIHVFLSSGGSFVYQGSQGWWSSTGYQPALVSGRVMCGDFNGDGKDDLAAFYRNGTANTALHVFLSTGTSFYYQGSQGWWNSTSYQCDLITDRVVAGDFNGDGKDDVAAFYRNGTSDTDLHVFLSSGTSFTLQSSPLWWYSLGYQSDLVSGRVLSGDYNGDGKTDIATFYRNSSTGTALHLFVSTGSAFTYAGSQGWWTSSQYNCDAITKRVVSGDFDGDGKDDIVGLHCYDQADAGNVRTEFWRAVNDGGYHFLDYLDQGGLAWLMAVAF